MIVVRRARRWSIGDIRFLHRLRNSAGDFKPVGWIDHLLWVLLAWPPLCLIACDGRRRVGYCRASSGGVISIAVSRDYRGLGIGHLLLLSAQRRKPSQMSRYYAIVDHKNYKSQALFTRAGFVLDQSKLFELRYCWPTAPTKSDHLKLVS